MTAQLNGLHHVTAITADAQKNIDFYTGVLGLRLVKLTVNFDDPGSYHLYYGDELGRPGTCMTFFAWPGAPRGRLGPPQVTSTAFAVPAASFDYWLQRLDEHGVKLEPQPHRFSERHLHFTDSDGMPLDIVALANAAGQPWASGPVPVDHAIRGFHSVTIAEEGYETTAKLLTEMMGFTSIANDGNRFRYRAAGAGNFANIIDIVCTPDARRGDLGAGIVHHVAFRTPDDAQQQSWHREIANRGFNVSPIMDRQYFHSIYFREPGGVLFEIATENPGFTFDEPAESLGGALKLPPQYEPYRVEIEKFVPKVRLPSQKK